MTTETSAPPVPERSPSGATDPFYEDSWLQLWQGDCRDVLDVLPEKSVHMVVTSPPYFGLRSYLPEDHPDKAKEVGREPTPQEFVDALVEVFRGVHRVLRDDGLAFLNLGDSYANDSKWGGATGGKHVTALHGQTSIGRERRTTGLKSKDLIGIPWRAAFALQDDGWYLRNDIVWAPPNGMPESVSDRFTSAHEYIFMLAKSPAYYFDQDAVREPNADISIARAKKPLNQTHPDNVGVAMPPEQGRRIEGDLKDGSARVIESPMGERFVNPAGRNKRDVWTIPTVSYRGAHYAVFPPKLVEPCVLAATSERGVCPECGAPWRRVVEKVREPRGDSFGRKDIGEYDHGQAGAPYEEVVDIVTKGWEPSCSHQGSPIPATVLDPFAGSGTVGLVAQGLSRRAVLIDLNGEYLAQQLGRNAQVPLGFVTDGAPSAKKQTRPTFKLPEPEAETTPLWGMEETNGYSAVNRGRDRDASPSGVDGE